MTDKYVSIAGYCPACGGRDTIRAPRHANIGVLHCSAEGCPDKMAAAKILSDKEIHHIVRFDDESGTFNAQHPLRERVGQSLLDCAIHEEVLRWVADGGPSKGTWRLKDRDAVEGEEYNEWPWLWERL